MSLNTSAASAGYQALSPTPLGGITLGLGMASGLLGGKGGRGTTYEPQFRVDPSTGNYQIANTVTGESADGKWQNASSTWAAPGYQQGSVTAKPVRDTSWNPLAGGRGGNSIAAMAAGKPAAPTAAQQVNTQTNALRDMTGIQNLVKSNPNGKFADSQPSPQALAQALQAQPQAAQQPPSYIDPRTVAPYQAAPPPVAPQTARTPQSAPQAAPARALGNLTGVYSVFK
jgi:hypothetical protein